MASDETRASRDENFGHEESVIGQATPIAAARGLRLATGEKGERARSTMCQGPGGL